MQEILSTQQYTNRNTASSQQTHRRSSISNRVLLGGRGVRGGGGCGVEPPQNTLSC